MITNFYLRKTSRALKSWRSLRYLTMYEERTIFSKITDSVEFNNLSLVKKIQVRNILFALEVDYEKKDFLSEMKISLEFYNEFYDEHNGIDYLHHVDFRYLNEANEYDFLGIDKDSLEKMMPMIEKLVDLAYILWVFPEVGSYNSMQDAKSNAISYLINLGYSNNEAEEIVGINFPY